MSKLIAIDCGHGMYTSGKETVKLTEDLVIEDKVVKKKGQRIKENEFNRAVGKKLGDALKRCGFKVLYVSDMTGKTDIPLSTRASKANNANADYFVSCHYNAVGSCNTWQTKCKGLLVLKTKGCSNGSTKIAGLIHKHLIVDCNYEHDYGVGIDANWSGFTLAVLRQTKMPATLIEFGFMDYKKEALKMLDPKWQNTCAEATCKGICEYFGAKYVKPSTTPATTTAFKPYIVKVIVNELNARKGAGTNYEIECVLKKGTAVTVTKEKTVNGSKWGLCKAGYYINLSSKYVKKI